MIDQYVMNMISDARREGRKEGRKEVVKWMKKPCPHKIEMMADGRFAHITQGECTKCRQAKLKEWGIK